MRDQPTVPTMLSLRQIPALDGIRGIAILWVIIHNTTSLETEEVTGVFYVLKLLTNPGWIGVQLFFALSGFLITGKLLDSNTATNYFGGFYAKRFLRIFPLYFGVLAIILLLPAALGVTPESLRATTEHQWWLWLFLSNFAPLSLNGFGHFWSLAIEEQFYLVWPLLLQRLSPRRVAELCLAICTAALVVRCVMLWRGADPMAIYNSTFCRVDALAAGGAGAALLRMPAGAAFLRRHATGIVAGTVSLFLFGILTTTGFSMASDNGQTYGYSILALACAVLTVYAAMTPANRFIGWVNGLLDTRWLISLGKYSFGMYVVHGLLYKLIGDPFLLSQFGTPLPLAILFSYSLGILGMSYALAWVSYHSYEKHFLRLKRFFEPARAQRAAEVRTDTVS
jgi:peptidoglycan/LPS O-acetylase OafA/YrhL